MLSELTPNQYFSGGSFNADLTDDLQFHSNSLHREKIWEQTVQTIAKIPEIFVTWILVYQPDTHSFHLLAIHGSEDLDFPKTIPKSQLPCSNVIDSNMIFEINLLEDDFLFKSLRINNFNKSSTIYLGYPIRSDIGTVIGVIGMIAENKFKHKFKNLKLIDVLADKLSLELIRYKNEKFISESLNNCSFVKQSLGELYRLLSYQTDDIVKICRNYLQAGIKLFGLPLGLIATKIGDGWEYSFIEGNVHGIYEGQKFSDVEFNFSIFNSSGNARIIKNLSVETSPLVQEHLGLLGVSCLMEFPLQVHNQRIGLFGFYGFGEQNIQSSEIIQRIFELMGIGLSNSIEKNKIPPFSKFNHLDEKIQNQ
ncbi:MAG: GAF domain-containing protein [Leptospira sp.]|uniref:GAF domain-containing protein n=1 Tax=Leptospira sp. TaxID=178 RepID=UPI0025BC6334|nr:GAF domain-containing protein [Leptospira sp.]MBL0955367.1 GAF domain-containing protein [Leptospira sp.]